MWGEPSFRRSCINSRRFQLTRPVWGEPYECCHLLAPLNISTHSPRVGRTVKRTGSREVCSAFQLTRPVWGEPFRPKGRNRFHRFQLTRPVWGEPQSAITQYIGLSFQLTRPVWGEPRQMPYVTSIVIISTHSPRVGRTHLREKLRDRVRNFNSLAPCGANPPPCYNNTRKHNFNSLAPCGANLAGWIRLH